MRTFIPIDEVARDLGFQSLKEMLKDDTLLPVLRETLGDAQLLELQSSDAQRKAWKKFYLARFKSVEG